VFCLKGTGEELKYIPEIWLNQQKQKILITTKGKLGCEVFIFGKKFKIDVKKKIPVLNTIGAGDVFFAYTISKFLKTTNFVESIRCAIKKTTEFLLLKRK
ncbi:MAG: PfkB family carbohydrate kinase, partial [Candidatus Paceibacterales bacterium]